MIIPVRKANGIIYPTNTCFDDALDLIGDIITVHPRRRGTLFLVHALCKPEKEIFAHAWVEEGEEAYWFGILNKQRMLFGSPRKKYRTGLGAFDITRYSVKHAAQENNRTNHYGPWIDRYQKYCKERGRIISALS